MSLQVPVCIIGCGPIGLAGALLLSKFGIASLIVERRGDVNTHPRSRFVDTNTMELMRVLGLEKAIEATGLGAEWTGYNRWFNALTRDEVAAIPSPTFHTVPRETSPTMPVMTCQDYVENVLLSRVAEDDRIEVRYRTEATQIEEHASGVRVDIRNVDDDVTTTVQAQYVLGTDGPHSFARRVIGSEMDATPRPQYSQDVIFEAYLAEYVEGRKAGLLYNLTASGVLVFQPLNGMTRWRCQIFKPDPDLLSEDETIARIREAIGVDNVAISITSMGIWQPTPGCVDKLSKGRVFLAGDAAHVSLPTGGMGNNIGFAGVRNLTWKMAYVMHGYVDAGILETYQTEHHALALDRIAVGIKTTEYMGTFIRAYYQGADIAPGVELTRQYADYDGALLGFELKSELIAEEAAPPPPVADTTIDFIACVRAGRRAPHVWVSEAEQRSTLDWFDVSYTLLVGRSVDVQAWQDAMESLGNACPLELRVLDVAHSGPYLPDALVLVRPDGIVADHWQAAAIRPGEEVARLQRLLPKQLAG
ncbi:MAG: FAD-dependent monooxygenase [Pseudomonadota bacterium]